MLQFLLLNVNEIKQIKGTYVPNAIQAKLSVPLSLQVSIQKNNKFVHLEPYIGVKQYFRNAFLSYMALLDASDDHY